MRPVWSVTHLNAISHYDQRDLHRYNVSCIKISTSLQLRSFFMNVLQLSSSKPKSTSSVEYLILRGLCWMGWPSRSVRFASDAGHGPFSGCDKSSLTYLNPAIKALITFGECRRELENTKVVVGHENNEKTRKEA